MKRIRIYALLLALVMLALSGCTAQPATDAAGDATQPTETQASDAVVNAPEVIGAEGEGTIKPNLTVGVQLDLDMLDPQNSTQTVSTRMQPLLTRRF